MATEWNKMTVNQLKNELSKRGLEKTGPKAELVKRLVKAESENEEVVNETAENESVFDSSKVHDETEMADGEATEQEKSQTSEETKNPDQDDVKDEKTTSEVSPSTNDKDKSGEETMDVKTEESKEEGKEDITDQDKTPSQDTADEKKTEEDPEQSATKKTKKGQKKWVAIMENENSDVILEELEKINKLECLKGRSKEIFQVHETHKIRLFPIFPSDLAEPLILDAIKQSISSMAKFNCSDPQSEPKGLLEVTFPKRSKLDEFFPKLSLFKESVSVIVDKKENEWKDQYKQAVDVPEHASDLERLRLFAPSLPQSITEDDMWDYFPKAKEILLVSATPRKHAYITFLSEEAMLQSVEELNVRGPQKSDFKFCRLLRLSDVVKLISRRGVRRALKRPVKRSPDEGSVDPKTGQTDTAVRPQKAIGQTKTKAFRPSGGIRARELLQRRRARGDKSGHKTSYWRAPSQRSSGHALENAFSQLQQPSSLVNPQAQQGLHVLDTLLNTLGQMGGNTEVEASQMTGRQTDNRPYMPRMQQRQRYTSNGQKRFHSPDEGGQDFASRFNKKPRRRYIRPNFRYQDNMQRNNYDQARPYDGGMMNVGDTNSMNYSANDGNNYGRQDDMRTNRMFNAFDNSDRMRDSFEPQQNQVYGMSGPGYRQNNYY